jgi:hypothetical protein
MEIKPSHFVAMGRPSCSCWGKTEVEIIALAYVQAMANDGDVWKQIPRERVLPLLTDDQKRSGMVYGLLDGDYYQGWFDSVARRITDAEGAFSVRGFWNDYRFEKANGFSPNGSGVEK